MSASIRAGSLIRTLPSRRLAIVEYMNPDESFVDPAFSARVFLSDGTREFVHLRPEYYEIIAN